MIVSADLTDCESRERFLSRTGYLLRLHISEGTCFQTVIHHPKPSRPFRWISMVIHTNSDCPGHLHHFHICTTGLASDQLLRIWFCHLLSIHIVLGRLDGLCWKPSRVSFWGRLGFVLKQGLLDHPPFWVCGTSLLSSRHIMFQNHPPWRIKPCIWTIPLTKIALLVLHIAYLLADLIITAMKSAL